MPSIVAYNEITYKYIMIKFLKERLQRCVELIVSFPVSRLHSYMSKCIRNESRYTLQFSTRSLVFLSAVMRHPSSQNCDKEYLISVICSSRVIIYDSNSRKRSKLSRKSRDTLRRKQGRYFIRLDGYLIKFLIEFVCF